MTRFQQSDSAATRSFVLTQEEVRLLRRLEILKLLHGKEMRVGEIAEFFNVDERTIRSDVSALREGMDFFGVKIQIESKHEGNQRHWYKSTVHPFFLALNLSEILALLKLLEDASKGDFSGEVYSNIFNTVYAQLTEYARNKLDDRLEKTHCKTELRNILEEEAVRNSMDHALVYLLKSGKHVAVTFLDEGDSNTEVQIVDINGREIVVRTPDGDERVVEPDDILIDWRSIDYE